MWDLRAWVRLTNTFSVAGVKTSRLDEPRYSKPYSNSVSKSCKWIDREMFSFPFVYFQFYFIKKDNMWNNKIYNGEETITGQVSFGKMNGFMCEYSASSSVLWLWFDLAKSGLNVWVLELLFNWSSAQLPPYCCGLGLIQRRSGLNNEFWKIVQLIICWASLCEATGF